MSGSCIPRPNFCLVSPEGSRKGKKRGSFSLIKTALIIIRGPKKTHVQKIKSNENQEVFTESLTKFVGSMRPLHLQDNIDSPTPSLPSLSPSPSLNDLVRSRASSLSSSSSSSTSSPSLGMTSQYASANNLHELDECVEDEDPDEVFEATVGDDLIDSKAEQFIAQFYQQMKLEKINR